ncbi:MAG: AAA domain-containing protein [Chitinivibrionales bacterium]|nr:AAA domain-containing protein [Chitinivibrionales bacterium]
MTGRCPWRAPTMKSRSARSFCAGWMSRILSTSMERNSPRTEKGCLRFRSRPDVTKSLSMVRRNPRWCATWKSYPIRLSNGMCAKRGMLMSNGVSPIADALKLMARLAGENDETGLLRQGLELCVKVLDCDRGLIIAENGDGKRTIIEHAGKTLADQSFSRTALRLVREKGEPLLISDTIEDEELSVQESIARHDIRSILCTQISSWKRDAAAYLYLDSQTDRHPFSNDDFDNFRILSHLLESLLNKSERLAEQEATIEVLKGKVEQKQFEDLIFNSRKFEHCLKLVKQSAPAQVPVLLIGETGTGKEELARIVHTLSPRKAKPFLAVNCGALPQNLIESQLFGHEKGAFTGAISSKRGYFEEADGGTLFLDEVGELPMQVQAQFLRALQQGEIMRVGSAKPAKVDVRIVSATNVMLEDAVDKGAFRKDLYYRLNVMPITVPPIRERGEDALLLANFFLKKYAEAFGGKHMTLSREAQKAIMAYAWPGNVREIQNKVQRAVITSPTPTISKDDLDLAGTDRPAHSTLREAREAVDREMIDMSFERAPGNLTQAAGILGIDRKSLRILLEKYDIEIK